MDGKERVQNTVFNFRITLDTNINYNLYEIYKKPFYTIKDENIITSNLCLIKVGQNSGQKIYNFSSVQMCTNLRNI